MTVKNEEAVRHILFKLRNYGFPIDSAMKQLEPYLKETPPSEIKVPEQLRQLNRNNVDIESNDDLFTLILEQRWVIKEILQYLEALVKR